MSDVTYHVSYDVMGTVIKLWDVVNVTLCCHVNMSCQIWCHICDVILQWQYSWEKEVFPIVIHCQAEEEGKEAVCKFTLRWWSELCLDLTPCNIIISKLHWAHLAGTSAVKWLCVECFCWKSPADWSVNESLTCWVDCLWYLPTADSLTHSLLDPLTLPSWIHLPTHSLTDSFSHSLTHPLSVKLISFIVTLLIVCRACSRVRNRGQIVSCVGGWAGWKGGRVGGIHHQAIPVSDVTLRHCAFLFLKLLLLWDIVHSSNCFYFETFHCAHVLWSRQSKTVLTLTDGHDMFTELLTEHAGHSHIMYAVIEKSPEGSYIIKPLKQKQFVDGLCYLLQEIYGIENKNMERLKVGHVLSALVFCRGPGAVCSGFRLGARCCLVLFFFVGKMLSALVFLGKMLSSLVFFRGQDVCLFCHVSFHKALLCSSCPLLKNFRVSSVFIYIYTLWE